jgi:hypothetical protein
LQALGYSGGFVQELLLADLASAETKRIGAKLRPVKVRRIRITTVGRLELGRLP